jgi:phytoene/squalene synthetase
MCAESAAAIRRGFRCCRALARTHYENFPVASWLLPRRLRDPVAAIYAFARSADDIADEGTLSKPQRLERLAVMETMLLAPQGTGAPSHPCSSRSLTLLSATNLPSHRSMIC